MTAAVRPELAGDRAPHASVILPVRSCAQTLPTMLAELDRQRLPGGSLEVVVVDDGSTDDTPAIVAGHRSVHRLVSVREPPDGSPWCPGKVRNRGLAAATGDIAIFLDADVIPGPGLVASHVARHAAATRPIAVLGYLFGYPIDPARRVPAVLRPPPVEAILDRLVELVAEAPDDWRDGREPELALWPELHGCPWPWQLCWSGNLSVRRATALSCGGFDEALSGWGGEDTELGFRLFASGIDLELERRAWGVHYPHPRRQPPPAAVEANIRFILQKHGDPRLELSLWPIVRAIGSDVAVLHGLEVMDVLAAPPQLPPLAGRDARSALEALELKHRGPVIAIGELDPGLHGDLPIGARCRPFITDRRGAETAGFLGLLLPYDDRSFTAALLIDYWRAFSNDVVDHLVREAVRVAGRAILVATDGLDLPDRGPIASTAGICGRLQRVGAVTTQVIEAAPRAG
jgi:Glycosyl transferase family 2/N-terminal domain of galactosyltransferase